MKILRFFIVSVIATLSLGLALPAVSSAWAPAASATVHPGVQTYTQGGQCTSNFVFQSGSDVFIGQAAHCSGTGEATDTDGCQAGTRPIGTPVEVTGASRPGVLAYSSWNTMQARGESDAATCAFNDFALVRIDPADVDKVNPSVPGFGGPTGLGAPGGLGSTVYSWGNSSLRQGIRLLSPKQGIAISNDASGWSHNVYTLTPGIPGDSGSGFLNRSGQAFGTLSTLQLLPTVGANGVGDLAEELAYLKANEPAFSGTELVKGTEPFRPNLVGAILGG